MSYKKLAKDIIKQSWSNIAIIAGVILAFLLIILIENYNPIKNKDFSEMTWVKSFPKARHGALTEKELQWAKNAWQYFETNYQESTGLINATDKFEVVSMWEVASYMMALVAAKKLELIDADLLHQRFTKVLNTLERLPLFFGRLPNKAYNSRNLMMVDYNDPLTNKPRGWSALDIARLLVPLYYIGWAYPEYAEQVRAIIKRWDLKSLTRKGYLQGASFEKSGIMLEQEGRIGYEEYAAKSLQLFGLDVVKAAQTDMYLEFKYISGSEVPTDIRSPKTHRAQNYTLTEPFILDAFEFGLDTNSTSLAYRVYKAQEGRFHETGIYTAVSEDNIDQAPFFVYNSVFAAGKEWHAVTQDGIDADDYKTLSTKAAIGLYILYNTDYTSELAKQVEFLSTPKGWFAGIYEKGHNTNAVLTANTNAVILEALCFKKFGSLIPSLIHQNRGLNEFK